MSDCYTCVSLPRPAVCAVLLTCYALDIKRATECPCRGLQFSIYHVILLMMLGIQVASDLAVGQGDASVTDIVDSSLATETHRGTPPG